MEKHQIVIDIATHGWASEVWQGYYPADLPEDWRLDFYSNEHRAVVVPAEAWQEASHDLLREWQDAVHDEFRFYFEVTDGLPLLNMDALGAQWGGWVSRAPCTIEDVTPSIWYEGEAEPRQMREAIEQLHQALGGRTRGVIVVTSEHEPWQVASDMRQLVELMGYG